MILIERLILLNTKKFEYFPFFRREKQRLKEIKYTIFHNFIMVIIDEV